MRCVVQRVKRAGVKIGSELTGQIDCGLLVFVGFGHEDGPQDLAWMAEKLIKLRIFEDEQGKMNLSLLDVQGELLVVSQFTLYGDCRKGNRPSFTQAAPPQKAESLFNDFLALLRQKGVKIQTGRFQAEMDVELVNQGPVTILLDSKKQF